MRRDRRRRATRGIEPARGRAPAPAGSATAARRPSASSRGSARTVAPGPSSDDPPGVDHDDPVAQPVEQVGLVLDDEQRGPGRRELAERLADQPRPLRVELGGRLVEDEVGRPHRQQRGDRPRAAPGRRTAAAARARRGPRCRGSRAPPCVRATVSRAGRPRFIGPSATSSKTEPVTPDSWVAGFWNPIPTRVANSWSGLPAIDVAVDRRPSPVSAPPIEPGARPEATRHSVDLPASFAPTTPDDLAVGEASGRCRGGRASRSRRSGTRPPSKLEHRLAQSRPATRNATDGHDERQRRAASAATALPRACRPSPTADGACPAG